MKYLLMVLLAGSLLTGCDQPNGYPDQQAEAAHRAFQRQQDVLDAQNDVKVSLIQYKGRLEIEKLGVEVARLEAEQNRLAEREAKFEASLKPADNGHDDGCTNAGGDCIQLQQQDFRGDAAARNEQSQDSAVEQACQKDGEHLAYAMHDSDGNIVDAQCQ